MKKNSIKKFVSIAICATLTVSSCVCVGATSLPENTNGIVEVVAERTEINNCYSYVCCLLDKFGDVLTQEDYNFFNEIRFEIQGNFLYPENKENAGKSIAEIKQKLLDYKLTTQNPDICSFEDFLKIKELAQTKLDNEKQNQYMETMIGIPIFKNFEGFFIVYARYNIEEPMPISERYGDYIIEDVNRSIPSVFGYLAVNPETGDIITLEDGLANGKIDEDKLFETSFENMYKLGDADSDGMLTVKDATIVQKAGVGLAETVKTKYGFDTVFDYNNDGIVNVLDSTCIQKKLADIDNK